MMCDTRATRVPESLGREYRDRSTPIAVFEKQNKKNEKKKREKRKAEKEREKGKKEENEERKKE